MNFALPSGSSPPEKPPGSMTIWLSLMALTSASQLAVTSAGVRLRMTSTGLFVATALISFAVLTVVYTLVYKATSNAYYRIVKGSI